MPDNAVAPEVLTLDAAQVRETLRREYGIEARSLQSMPSELATVFRVDTAHRGSLAFKASRYSDADFAIARWRTDAMERLASLGVPAGRTISSVAGQPLALIDGESQRVIIHVSEWLEGNPLDSIEPSQPLLRAVGRVAAETSLGLADWPEPPAPIAHTWELTRTLETLAATMSAGTDPAVRAMLQASYDRFAEHVDGRLATLPHQVVHHDLHDSNLLVTGDAVTGVLDFGDMVWAPRVAELVVAGAYASRRSPEPVAALLEVASGWGTRVPLLDDEIDVIFDSVVARLAVNLSVWTSRRASDRGAYAASRSSGVERVVGAYLGADRDAAQADLRARLR